MKVWSKSYEVCVIFYLLVNKKAETRLSRLLVIALYFCWV